MNKREATHHALEYFRFYCIPLESERELANTIIVNYDKGHSLTLCEHKVENDLTRYDLYLPTFPKKHQVLY
jgi:hypothetical protein